MDYEQVKKCAMILGIKTGWVTDNVFAYNVEMFKKTEDEKYNDRAYMFVKSMNFAPSYDKWCLVCWKEGSTKRCGKCRSVHYCSSECASKAWPVHKEHCGRDLFTVCINCGSSETELKCDRCPVKFCSQECKEAIGALHVEYDCDHFSKTFTA